MYHAGMAKSNVIPYTTIRLAAVQSRTIAAELEDHINCLRGRQTTDVLDRPIDPIIDARIANIREFIDNELKR